MIFYMFFTLAGASIRAFQVTSRHIIVFEDDLDNFTTIMQPLVAKPSLSVATNKASKNVVKPLLEERPAKKPKRNRIACA